MIYGQPASDAPLDQGDLIDNCPILRISGFRADLGQPESVDYEGRPRRARLQAPYREHLAKHFGDTFSRIGLPRPYETM
jgi:hypothetical protein